MTAQIVDSQPASKITHEEMIRRAKDLIPVLRQRAENCEKLRRVPDETLNDFRTAMIHRISQPVPFGGVGLDMDTVFEVAIQLGRGCGSSAWMGSFWPLHNWMIGMWPKEVQEEYWGPSYDTLSSSVSAVVKSKVDRVKGGLKLSGVWDFSSGVDHAEWLMIFQPVEQGVELYLLPKKDYRIEDNWFVSGASGTGSKAIIIEDAFVPEPRILDGALVQTGRTPGRDLYDTTFYRIPLFSWLGYSIASPIIGIAQGMVDLFEEQTLKRTDIQTGEKAIERPANQLRLAESSVEVDAALQLLRRDIRDYAEWARSDSLPPLAERARMRRDIAYCAKLCLQAAYRIFEAAGGHSIYRFNPVQRLFRDITALDHSIAVTWDQPAEQYARVRWGLPPNTFQI